MKQVYGETKSVRLSLSLQPSLFQLVQERTANINDYLGNLIIADLKHSGLLSEERLREIISG